jgi:hypothetical protein
VSAQLDADHEGNPPGVSLEERRGPTQRRDAAGAAQSEHRDPLYPPGQPDPRGQRGIQRRCGQAGRGDEEQVADPIRVHAGPIEAGSGRLDGQAKRIGLVAAVAFAETARGGVLLERPAEVPRLDAGRIEDRQRLAGVLIIGEEPGVPVAESAL